MENNNSEIYLSVVIPCYRTAEILRKELPLFRNFLNKNVPGFEIVIVDDGSDNSTDTEKAATESGALFLANEKNSGKGAAVRKGILQAKGKFIIFTDADIPYRYDAVLKMLKYLDSKEFDIVIGDRTLEQSEYFNKIKNQRKIGSAIFTFLVGRFVTSGLFDTQCGIKGFKREIAKTIFSRTKINGFAFDVETLYMALKRNYDIKRIPVVFRSTHEESSINIFKHGITMFMDLMRIKYYHLRGIYN